jgi:hypothetical protein
MSEFTLLAASATAAFKDLGIVRELAAEGNDALPVIAEQLDAAASALGRLTGSDAQRTIGPLVNVAEQAHAGIVDAARSAHAGVMFEPNAFDDVHRATAQVALNLAQRRTVTSSAISLDRLVANIRP